MTEVHEHLLEMWREDHPGQPDPDGEALRARRGLG
jgi:hypothetical protein